MNKFKITILFCALSCFYPLGRSQSAEGGSDSVALDQSLAQEIAAQHLLARIKADEMVAQQKFGLARHTVRQAQQNLISRRNDIPQTIFTFLKTLGSQKLLAIDTQELIFLRKRVANERAMQAKLASKVPSPTAIGAPPSARLTPAPATAKSVPLSQLALSRGRRARGGLRTRMPVVHYDETPLSEVLDDFRDKTGTNIVANWQSLANLGIDQTTPVSLNLRNVRAKLVLKLTLQALSSPQGRISYMIEDNVVFIAPGEDLDMTLKLRVYEIADILMETKDKRGESQFFPGSYDRDNSSGQRPNRPNDRNNSPRPRPNPIHR